MGLKKLVQRLVFSAALATIFSGYAGAETNNPAQFVSPNTADVRGEWYEHGQRGGWFGPNKEYHFGFWSFKQYGTNIQGRRQHELWSSFREAVGNIASNKLTLDLHWQNSTNDDVSCVTTLTINGDEAKGTNAYRRIFNGKDTNWKYDCFMERITNSLPEFIQRNRTP